MRIIWLNVVNFSVYIKMHKWVVMVTIFFIGFYKPHVELVRKFVMPVLDKTI